MIRILKQCCIYGGILFCGLVITNATLQRLVKPTPIKVYVIPKTEKKEYKKRNTKLYEHLKPKPIDRQKVFDNTIIENNIFAPLGYKPPLKTHTYRLVGTQIPIGRETEAIAILQETTGEKNMLSVSIGTKIAQDTVVMDIKPKQIIIKKGNRRTLLRLETWLLLNNRR